MNESRLTSPRKLHDFVVSRFPCFDQLWKSRNDSRSGLYFFTFIICSIQVNSDILLTGVKCITRVNGKACKSIELLDVKTRETIIKQPVIQDNTKQYNETTNSLSSLSLKPSLLLPKTFTGLIVSHYEEENDDGHHLCTETSLDVNEYFNNTGLISLLKVTHTYLFSISSLKIILNLHSIIRVIPIPHLESPVYN